MILQTGRNKGQDENLQFTQGRMTRQKAIPLRPLRDYVRYKTNVADINLEDLILCYISFIYYYSPTSNK